MVAMAQVMQGAVVEVALLVGSMVGMALVVHDIREVVMVELLLIPLLKSSSAMRIVMILATIQEYTSQICLQMLLLKS